MSNNILKRKINRDFYIIPISNRVKRVFLRAKIVGAKVVGGTTVSSKNQLSDLLFEMAEHSVECGKFKRAARLLKKSLKLLKIDSNYSKEIFIERTFFLINCYLTLAKEAFSNKKMRKHKKALKNALEVFTILKKDILLKENQKDELEIVYTKIIKGFLDEILFYYQKLPKDINKKDPENTFEESIALGRVFNLKKRIRKLLEEEEYLSFVIKQQIEKILNKICKIYA